jgi:hypothetical protein
MLNEYKEADEKDRREGGNSAFSIMDKTTLTRDKLSGRKRKWHQLNKTINLPRVLAFFLPIKVANLL